MAIFVIGDLHLSMDGKKTMEVFPGWEHYMQRLEENWRAAVLPEDLVVLLGDTSWAMSLQETLQDFAFLHTLPGKKLLLKGNHDYWWTTMAKMERFLPSRAGMTLPFYITTASCTTALPCAAQEAGCSMRVRRRMKR